ncbi:MAG: 50S ribosomal protein L9 [Chlamydiia bacterium]|nr:50S ribosomal protein L9 [Chlamydiia bacterium]
MKQQLLLLQDVEALGKKGEIVSARPGYIRNFLLPQGLAVIASPHTLRAQEKLRTERAKQAVIDKQESELLAQKMVGIVLEIRVKVDPEGHMYGSVSASDVVQLFKERDLPIERKNVQLTRPLKVTGVHDLSLRLKEGVTVQCKLHIIPEGVSMEGAESVVAPLPMEEGAQSEAEEPKSE